jgi:hypothetical protein
MTPSDLAAETPQSWVVTGDQLCSACGTIRRHLLRGSEGYFNLQHHLIFLDLGHAPLSAPIGKGQACSCCLCDPCVGDQEGSCVSDC